MSSIINWSPSIYVTKISIACVFKLSISLFTATVGRIPLFINLPKMYITVVGVICVRCDDFCLTIDRVEEGLETEVIHVMFLQ